MKMNISHGGVCIFITGVLTSCDAATYVRLVAHVSYLFTWTSLHLSGMFLRKNGVFGGMVGP
ncbi:hypothetical protein Hanom_Chr12g01074791 [Helianthus anomalus]